MKPSRRSTELLFLSNSVKVLLPAQGRGRRDRAVELPDLPRARPAHRRARRRQPRDDQDAGGHAGDQRGAEDDARRGASPKTWSPWSARSCVDPNVFTSLPFNHIVFTGSPAVGRIVMRTAAENLTPVTLELGGKSPALVTRHYPIADAAKRITHGKSTNAGQICVSPDYALVPRERVDEFVAGVRRAFASLYDGTAVGNADYTARRQRPPCSALRGAARRCACQGRHASTPCAPQPAGDGRQMPLQIVTGVTPRHARDERGAVRPDPAGRALRHDRRGHRATSTHARGRWRCTASATTAPSATSCCAAPTRAASRSTTGAGRSSTTTRRSAASATRAWAPITAIEGFRELSHAKTVFQRQRFFPIDLFYPPYGNFVQRLALTLLPRPRRHRAGGGASSHPVAARTAAHEAHIETHEH